MTKVMVIPVILQKTAEIAIRYGPRLITAEQKILRGVGYSHKSAKGISHGLFIGAVAGNLIGKDNGIEPDGEISVKNGPKTNKSNQARSRFKRNYSRRRKSPFCSCKRNRYSYSRR